MDDDDVVVSSLRESFHSVPSAAVPSILECVLSSSDVSPSSLFHSLLNAFEGQDEDQSPYISSFTTALCYLLKKSGTDPTALQSFIWRAYLPIMSITSANHHPFPNLIAQQLADVIIQSNTWKVIQLSLVPFSLRSLGISIGMQQSQDSDIHQWNQTSTDHSLSLSLPITCHILTSLLAASLGPNASSCAHTFSTNLLWDISSMTIRMLSLSPHNRSSAIHFLLPFIFRIFASHSSFQISLHGELHLLTRVSFLKNIWNCCQTLFSLGPLERRDAYSILSLYITIFYHQKGCQDGEFDITTQHEFWDEIRRGLVAKEAFVRKQSLDMLKISLLENDGRQCYTSLMDEHIHVQDSASLSMTKRAQWAQKEAKSLGVGQIYHVNNARSNAQQRLHAFVLLYEMLEEYGTHLVEAAWNHQISVLLHFPCEQRSSSNNFTGIHQSQMETLEGMFSWISVLWERGLCHENPQVRCLILQSFLNIDWKARGTITELVPESFVIGPFMQGLNDTVHHREFGVKGVYSSKTIEGATTFVLQFCKHFCMRERVAFMCRLASLVRHESFGRAGLMALSACIASAACGSQWCETSSCDVEHQKSAERDLFSNSKTDLLDTLRLVTESCKQHFNLNYRQQVCENVVDAASSVICTSDVPLETLMHFISTVPREFTDSGGSLRGNVQKWFSKCSETLPSSGPLSTRIHLLQSLSVFPQQFIKYHHSSDQFVTYDDGDLEAWEFEAQRWARVLFLVIINEHHLDLICKFLQTCGTTICEERSYLEWLPLKFLILNLALAQELQIMWLKSISCGFKVTSSMGSKKSDTSDQSTSTSTSVIFEKFTSTFLFILEEFVSFAKSACSIFWCFPVADSHLPSSVRGKLGGPSQRRLASSTTAATLDAILSVKTVAALSSWCTRCNNDASLVSTFTFLWSFAQKVIMSQKCDLNSETEAEISLAMYEALVPVLKAVTSCVTPMILDLVMASDKSLLREVKGRHWLDTMLLCFLQNINELLAVGTLARSRRAILMKWKWLCLNSLLSILHCVIENEVRCGNDTTFFSTASMKCVYFDLIGSLEKANESSVLPMLRSVRLVLGLFASGRLSSTVSSTDGLNIEMIWELVNSAWILHVSCNKRRVAHISALLSSVLHCSLFCDDTLHKNTENSQGPFKWFVQKILEEGTKSPRTIRLAALHLTGLWLVYPRTIRYYIEELKLLSLYGSVAFDEDFEAELNEGHDARIEVSMLAKGSEVELTEAFLNTELYARVSVAVLFHDLANLADNLGSIKETEGCLAARHAGKSFLLELLDSVVNDADLAKELYKKYSGIHRRKVRAWQMICILSRFVDEDIVQQVTSSLHICLYRNNMPSVRQYLEIFAIQIYLKFPSLVQEQLSPIFRDYNMRPQALSSYVFIAANIILHATEEVVRFRHLNELLPPVTPLLTSHHHSLRGFTQLLLHKVLSKMTPALDSDDSNTMPLEKRCLEDLKSYLAKNSDCVRLRASIEGFLDAFDSSTSATPAGIFTARHEEIEFECVPTSLMERVNVFLNDVREDLRSSMAKDMVIIKNESLSIGECMISSSLSNAERLHSQVPGEASFDFQKKITLSKHERLCNDLTTVSSEKEFYEPLVGGLEEEDLLFNQFLQARNLAMQKFRSSRQDFVLVASLLDRIPNLAGLARTCEVFNASCLAVSDASVINDKQFQLISVTAEKWVPIIEVPHGSMKVFLEKKKHEGFAILGLEQTANSVPLDQYTFPKKMVLVLGREKEGIPVDIIHVLDGCLEIPQLGVVRSLNVHVSGAIALWEYTRQQRRLQQ